MALRAVATLGIALLVVTAGCSWITGDGASPETTTTSRSPYDVPDETTTSATTTGPPTPAASPSFRDAVANHTAVLRSAGRFVVRERIDTGVRGTPFDRSFAADLDAGRYWWGIPPDPDDDVYDEGALYQNGSVVYRRTEQTNGSPRYRRVSPRPEPTPRILTRQSIRNIPNVLVLFPFERNGTATFEGEEMARYTAAEPSPFGCTAVSNSPGSLQNVTSFRATALVDDRGVVRKFECHLEGYLYTDEFYSERVLRTISEVGTATVRPPDGLDEAPPANRSDHRRGRAPRSGDRSHATRGVGRTRPPGDGPEPARRRERAANLLGRGTWVLS